MALTDTWGTRRTVWYHSRYYRANLLFEGNTVYLRDVHVYAGRYAEPWLTKPCPDAAMRVDALPVLDGYLWSRADGCARGNPGAR